MIVASGSETRKLPSPLIHSRFSSPSSERGEATDRFESLDMECKKVQYATRKIYTIEKSSKYSTLAFSQYKYKRTSSTRDRTPWKSMVENEHKQRFCHSTCHRITHTQRSDCGAQSTLTVRRQHVQYTIVQFKKCWIDTLHKTTQSILELSAECTSRILVPPRTDSCNDCTPHSTENRPSYTKNTVITVSYTHLTLPTTVPV